MLILLMLIGLSRPLISEAEAAFAAGVAARDDPVGARASFRRAADHYEQARRAGSLTSARHFLDQGNACLLCDDLPAAILAYRRGRRLDPAHRTLQTQLAFARALVVHSQPGNFGRPPVEHRPPWLPRLPVGVTLLVAAALNALSWPTALWAHIKRHRLARRTAGVTLPLAGLLLGALLVEEAINQDEVRTPLVVIAQDGVLLRKGNGEAYPRRYEEPVNRGVEARLLHERGGWVQLELSGKEVGWVPREYVLIDRED